MRSRNMRVWLRNPAGLLRARINGGGSVQLPIFPKETASSSEILAVLQVCTPRVIHGASRRIRP
jgi:hypothetical protein